MRNYSISELFNMARRELFALHAQIVAELATLAEGSPDHAVGLANLGNIRRVLARMGPNP